MRVKVYSHLKALPPTYGRLLDQASANCVFYSDWWYRCLIEHTLNPGDQLRLYGIELDEPGSRALGLFVARSHLTPFGPFRLRSLSGLSSFYTLRSGPILSPDATNKDEILEALADHIARERPHWDVVTVAFMVRGSPIFESVVRAFGKARMYTRPYFQYKIWQEDFGDRTFDQYMADRGRSFRKNVQWASRKIEKLDRIRYEMVTSEEGLEEALRAYEAVYADSWKEPESYEGFMPAMIRAAARQGHLRLSNMYLDEQPIATQVSLVAGHTVFQYKSAYAENIHDSAYLGNMSIGSLLLMRLVKHLIQEDEIQHFDFGVGDETYKARWCTVVREAWGIAVSNPRTLRGCCHALSQLAGSFASTLR